MVHRNTYINGPTVLRETWQTRVRPDLFFAGQVSGVEGYVESAASGLIAGRNAAALVQSRPLACRRGRRRLARWRTTCRTPMPGTYQPTNITHGIMPPLEQPAARQGAEEDAHRRTRACAISKRGTNRRDAVTVDAMKEHAARSFSTYLRFNRNASAHTVRAYESDITQYLAWFVGRAARRAGSAI